MQKTEDLLNWVVVSKQLTGGKESVRKNTIPKKHVKKVNELLKKVKQWQENHPSPTNKSKLQN